MSKNEKWRDESDFSRRGFLRATGVMAVVAGGVASGCGGATTKVISPASETGTETEGTVLAGRENAPEESNPILKHRTLGRTGFEVSEISMGCGHISESNVVRYAYDRGINLFDVAESYGNGDSERKIGEAMPYLDRKKIFLVTKLKVGDNDTEQTFRDRFGQCMERLRTDYIDALYMHGVTDIDTVKNSAFHSAVKRLKSDGKLKHAGLSSHGPRGEGASMEDVLTTAAVDGRFDLMLLVHNFLKSDEGERVLSICKEKNIGTTCMKANAGKLKVEPFDRNHPSEEYEHWIRALMARDNTRDEAISNIQERLKQTAAEIEKNRPAVDAFRAKYGVNTQEDIDNASVEWVLENPDMDTVCVSLPTFDKINQYLRISGAQLSGRSLKMLDDYRLAFGDQYCRHGCSECASKCPLGVPVSTVMRYAYYFENHGRQKHAMKKYALLEGRDGSLCIDCSAPCKDSCPYGVHIQAGLNKADAMLKLA